MPKYVSILPQGPEHVRHMESTTEELSSARRRVGVVIACNPCRHRKIRCDGKRPMCANCRRRRKRCSYRDDSALSQESQSIVFEIIRLLDAFPDDEVANKLRSLKKEIDAASILSLLRNQYAARQKLDYFATMAAMNDQFQSLELGPQNPNAYPAVPNLSLDVLQQDMYQQLVQPVKHDPDSVSTQGVRKNTAECNPAQLCDSRLASLDIIQWTNVPITNNQAAHAISLYLETDHPLLGLFNPELFVSDLTAARTDYCSSMLVTSLLYWSCQMYGTHDTECGALALSFCTEAESLWKHEREIDSILNLAAVQLLSVGYLCQGRDHAVVLHLVEASNMALRMGLFGVEENHGMDEMDFTSIQAKSAQSYASWGAFNWITHMSLFYRQPGLQCPRTLPRLPMPGTVELQHAHEPGDAVTLLSELEIKYMGNVFPYICQFWSILHELALLYKHKGPLASDRRTLCFAEYKFRELLAWSNRLPSNLLRNDKSPHYAQILHIWFHAAVLDLFRFSMSGPMSNKHLRTFTQPLSTPESVCIASSRQLKHLVMNYRLNFSSSSYTILWHPGLIYLANTILHYPKDDTWFYYFLLCIYGYERLRPCWRVSQPISTALLSMALRQGHISSTVARQVLQDIHNQSVTDIPGEVRATFMIDLDLAKSDPEVAVVEKVADDFDRNALLQEFTTMFHEG